MLSSRTSSPSLVIVTDRRLAPGVALCERLATLLDAVPPGAAMVQVREKDLGGRDLLALTRDVIAVARPRGAAVLVNDRLDVALVAGAEGVHLPEAGMSIAEARAVAEAVGRTIVVGCSRHDVAGAAAAAGADLVVLGPIWPTPSKAGMGAPLGLDALRQARAQRGDAAIIAIGGIEDGARASAARAAGASGIAAIRALWTADDPAAAARALVGS